MDEHTEKLLAVLDSDGRNLHLLLGRLTLREEVAEDLMQDLFLKLHRSRGFFHADNPRAYARRAAIHLAFDWRRRRRLDVKPLDTEPAGDAPSLLDRLIDREEVQRILEALDDTPKLARDCVLLRYLEQETYAEIADQMGKTPHQVRALCSKAIGRLRKLLRVESEEERPSGGVP